MKKLELVVCQSVIHPELLSLRIRYNEPSAKSLKKALVDAGFKDGDVVVVTLKQPSTTQRK